MHSCLLSWRTSTVDVRRCSAHERQPSSEDSVLLLGGAGDVDGGRFGLSQAARDGGSLPGGQDSGADGRARGQVPDLGIVERVRK